MKLNEELLGIDGPVLPGAEAEHNSLLEGLSFDPGVYGRIAGMKVGEDLWKLCLEPLPVVGYIRDTFYAVK